MRSLWNLIPLPSFLRRAETVASIPCPRCAPAPATTAADVPRPAGQPFTAAEWGQVVRVAVIDKIDEVLSESYALLADHTPSEPAHSEDLARIRRIRTALTAIAEDLGPRARRARPGERDWIESELLSTVLSAETEIGRLFAGLR
ncbi:hypothetical protein BJF83_05970 [Nocardiopsis sp. CNR-923]|uniref:hypothetical protein n=1 Tax=Nocardiopsis sp. CNR-923 TaxID=1904965 RepID=UPI00095E4A34|nr:hypothetical protein [Nocardiopsis sp. CNR-923]OLT25009.1 hypothetical protein BJF83_05970 [Nocardiopsis sp. CNR-923]